jgi:glutathione peroxidase
MKKLITLLTALFVSSGANAQQTDMNAYSFSFKSIDGQEMPLSDFKGKVILVVNTASQCGFTSQYAGLEELWDKYKDKGLVVLGVPSNDFGNQEPGSESEIRDFCTKKFDVSFPMTEKYSVKGSEAHPFYKWANEQTSLLGTPKWNFHKYLIGKDGKLIDWFSSVTTPTSEKIISAVEKALK